MTGWQQFSVLMFGIFSAFMLLSGLITRHYRYMEKRLEADK